MINHFSRMNRMAFAAVVLAPVVIVALLSGAGPLRRFRRGDDQPPANNPEPANNPAGAAGPRTAKLEPPDAAAGSKPEKTDAPPATEKFDPIKQNGTYFDGWTKPDLAIVITGRQDGYIEPCGCTGLDNQKGGLSRRHALFKQLQAEGWPLLPVDAGGLVHRYGRQAEIKFGISAEGLKTMGYQAVGFGADDLKLSTTEIAAIVAGPKGPDSSMFVSANVNVFDLTPRTKTIEQAGRKIGITSVLGDTYRKGINNPDVQIKPAAEALAEIVDTLEGCDIRILLAAATLDETKALAKQFPQFQIVVAGDGGEEPPDRATPIAGTKNALIEIGHKGMYAIVLGLYDNETVVTRYQRVALDSRFPGTPEMKQLMVNYQDQLEALGWQGLELRAVANPRGLGGDKLSGQYAGVASCKECHPTAYRIWEKTKHAQATTALVKADPPRQYDPECISCHATGWNPKDHFPYVTGFDSLKTTPQLAGNSCENCHGPGAAHVAAENGKNGAKRDQQRTALKLQVALAEQNLCIHCHDGDNDPNFSRTDFNVYWQKVKHEGKK